MIMTWRVKKSAWCLVLEKVVALKRASCDRNGRVIVGWLIQRMHAFCGPAFWQCLASLAVNTLLLDGTITVCLCRTYVPGTRRKSVLVLLTFCLPHSMQHSKCCKDRSESVVSVTIQHVIFAGLSSAVQHNPSWLRDAALVAHVVHQILLQLLRAVQMWRCTEDIKIRIGELVPLTTFALCFAIFWVIV